MFDVLYKQSKVEHRLIPPRHPQTNSMVKRFNARISEIVKQTRFGSAAEPHQRCATTQNFSITTFLNAL